MGGLLKGGGLVEREMNTVHDLLLDNEFIIIREYYVGLHICVSESVSVSVWFLDRGSSILGEGFSQKLNGMLTAILLPDHWS